MEKDRRSTRYNFKPDLVGLRAAWEVGPIAVAQKIVGIVKNYISAENEQLNPENAYWSGWYRIGTDGHGEAALVSSELGMIPGRVHRRDSNAMSDSMIRNVAYTLDRINEGNLPHSSWRAAKEQVRQFKAFQQEVLTLKDGKSILGYAMNCETTEDGISLLHVTRHGKKIFYESRLVGGMSEEAAKDLLDRFSSKDAVRVPLKKGIDNPLYSVVKGNIDIDLKDKKQIASIVQDVLDKRHETPSQRISLGSCRTVAVEPEQTPIKSVVAVESVAPKKQEPKLGVKHEKVNPFTHLPLAPVYYDDKRPYGWFRQKDIWDNSVRPWISTDVSKMPEDDVLALDDAPKNKIQKIDRQISVQRTNQEEIIQTSKRVIQKADIHHDNNETPFVPIKVLFQADPQPIVKQTRAYLVEPIEKQDEVFSQLGIVVPITTFVTAFDKQVEFRHQEKAIVISIVANHRKHVERTTHQYISIPDDVPVIVQQQKEDVRDVVVQQIIQEEQYGPDMTQTTTKEDPVYEVDQLFIQGINDLTKQLGKQIARGESVFSKVAKLVWMMPNDHDTELVSVEEVEIAQDATRTLYNLLHFLRKVIRKYVGDDTIRERIVQRMKSDIWDDGVGMPENRMLEEITEYLTIMKTQRMYNHLFAVVN